MTKETVRTDVTLQQQRQEWSAHAASLPLAPGTWAEEEVIGGVPCSWVLHEQSRASGIVLYAHGGGLVTGAAITHREFASRLAARTRRKVLLIDYRLLPENPVQAPLEDFLAAYKGLLEREEVFPGSIVFGGDSNGAGVVLAALVSLRDAGEQQPACVFSLSGAFDATLSGESMQTRGNLDPLLSLEVLEDWQRQLGAANLSASLLSPLFSDLSNLAPVLLEVGDHEMWLSDSLRVAEKIRLTGGEAELHVWDEMWHVWPMYTGFPESDAAIDEVSRFIARHVGECAY